MCCPLCFTFFPYTTLFRSFYGIILFSFFFTYDLIFDYTMENISWILVVTIIGVLIPMYLLQKGIQYCETFLVMMSDRKSTRLNSSHVAISYAVSCLLKKIK